VLLLGFALALGCKGAAPASAPAEPPSADLDALFMAQCQPSCERERQMQAVAAEAITAGCEQDCQRRSEAPLLTDRAGLLAHRGQNVRVRGHLDSSGKDFELELTDGRVKLSPEATSEDLSPHLKHAVLLLARVADREAELRLERVDLVVALP
jgi:hypothetical protein